MEKRSYATDVLPEGYEIRHTIDLANNRREMTFVTILSLVLLVGVFLLGFLIRPDLSVITEEKSQVPLAMILALAGYAVYIILHEAVHGVFMWYFSGRKPRFGISWQYAYAGSDAFFRRTPYLTVGLAPLVVWGIVFLVAAFLSSGIWFWLFWFLQAGNISGAAGDLYVAFKVCAMQPDILVQDDGVSMRIYAPSETIATQPAIS